MGGGVPDLGHAGQIWHLVLIPLTIPTFITYSPGRRDHGRGMRYLSHAWSSRERGSSGGGHATETVKKEEWGKEWKEDQDDGRDWSR